LTPAVPIRDLCEQLAARYPDHASTFNWYADEAHYSAVPPLDHTPYSVDGWPQPDPHWFVCATDVMAASVGGVDELDRLFRYWLGEAKAGGAPWIKYLIWQATIYDVRHGWVAQANADHFDHVHISTRTDHLETSLTGWSAVPQPKGDDEMFLANVKNEATVWKCNGVWRHRIEPGQAAWFDQLVAQYGKPVVYASEAELTYKGGKDVDSIPAGGGGDDGDQDVSLAEIAAATADELAKRLVG